MLTNRSEDKLFKSLADGTRRAILSEIAAEPRPVHDIAERFSVTRPAVSRHLRILKEAGLVDGRRAGRETVYFLKTSTLRELEEWLNALWATRLTQLKALVEGERHE